MVKATVEATGDQIFPPFKWMQHHHNYQGESSSAGQKQSEDSDHQSKSIGNQC